MLNFTIIEAFSHAECIYSQVLCIKKAGMKVHFIGNINLKDRVEIYGFDSYTYYKESDFKKLSILFNIRKIIIQNKTDHVIFNTAQGNFVRSLCLLRFPKRIQFVGMMHNASKLHSSFSQKIINYKIKKYFVLNEYIVRSQSENISNIGIQEFYPIYFPEFKPVELKKPKDEIWITIPGAVEMHRKDYIGFINHIKDRSLIPSNIKFILLGRCKPLAGKGLEIIEWVGNNKMQDKVQLFTSFINDDIFHSYLMNSDFIMPLLHPNQRNYSDFLKSKISGSFNLAFSYKKPLLCHEDYSEYSDFKDNAVFYNEEIFLDVLSKISQKSMHLKTPLYEDDKWKLENQQQKYLNFFIR